MVVTAATFHLERSSLNTEAPLNAVEVNTVVNANKKKKKSQKKAKKKR